MTVKTNGKKLDKLILHDKLQNDAEYTTLDFNSIIIKAYKNGAETDETIEKGHVITENADKSGFDLIFNTTKLADEYIVTYHTVIQEDYFHGDNQKELKNQASWIMDGFLAIARCSPQRSLQKLKRRRTWTDE